MSKKMAKLLSLLCLFALLVTMVTACGGNGGDTSGDYSIVYEEEDPGAEDSNPNEPSTSGSENPGEQGGESNTPGVTTKTSKGGKTTKATKKPSSSSGSYTNADPAKYKGTTVKYATWKDWRLNEDGPVVTSFTKKYGINVEWVNVAQGEYISKIIGYIAAGNAPDVYIDTAFWPGTTAIAQPIDAMNLNTSHALWDQATFKTTTVNGKAYGVNTLGNIWSEADIMVYNKKLLKSLGIQDPSAYQKAGQWNLAACENIMKKLTESGKKGGFFSPNTMAAAYGTDWVKFENGKLSNNTGNAMLTNVYKKIAEWNEKGYVVKQDSFFNEGNVGLCTANAFALKKTGTFSSMNPNDIGYIELPDYDAKTKAQPCGLTRFYGVCKKAKNPVAAGIFLGYYLDSANYDMTKTFITTDSSTFFFKVTGAATEKKNTYLMPGIQDLVGGFNHITDFQYVAYEPSAQVATKIKEKSNKIDGYCKDVNNRIATNTK